MPNPPGRCIFCASSGNLSKEHLFPDWLKELFPRDKNATHSFGTIDPYQGLITREPKIAQVPKQGHIGSRKLRIVCKSCNETWLSRLEEEVMPFLTHMIIGKNVGLTPATQKVLARWASKTVMVAERSRPRDDGISQTERTWLMDNETPPENWLVWIAGYNGTAWRELGLCQQRGALQETPVRCAGTQRFYCAATTFAIGEVLFLVVNSSWNGIFDAFRNVDGNGLFRMWPPIERSIVWPPSDLLGDPQANAIANVLTQYPGFNQALNPMANWTFTM